MRKCSFHLSSVLQNTSSSFFTSFLQRLLCIYVPLVSGSTVVGGTVQTHSEIQSLSEKTCN